MFFKKKTSSLKAYCDGRMISIEKVNDEVFSQKMMGDGVAIQPVNGKLTSPCDGTVSMIFEQTGHAIGLIMDNQMEILLHIGLDTVNVKERLFCCNVKKGQKVKCGDLLITYDFDKLKAMNIDTVTMCVITSQGKAKDITFASEGEVIAGSSDILTYR